jgi:hypothetical protein
VKKAIERMGRHKIEWPNRISSAVYAKMSVTKMASKMWCFFSRMWRVVTGSIRVWQFMIMHPRTKGIHRAAGRENAKVLRKKMGIFGMAR